MDKKSTGFHIVLVEPEIPGNTGNISRLCAATGCKLHLVRPLGFSTDDKHLKRAGLDYWSLLEIYYHDKFADLQALYPEGRFFCHTTKTTKFHSDVSFQNGDFLVFGKETAGLPSTILDQYGLKRSGSLDRHVQYHPQEFHCLNWQVAVLFQRY